MLNQMRVISDINETVKYMVKQNLFLEKNDYISQKFNFKRETTKSFKGIVLPTFIVFIIGRIVMKICGHI